MTAGNSTRRFVPVTRWEEHVDRAVAGEDYGPLAISLHPVAPPGVSVYWLRGVLVVGIYPDADHGTVYRWHSGMDEPPTVIRWRSPESAPPDWPDCNKEGVA